MQAPKEESINRNRYFQGGYEPKCFNCGERGHIASACKKENLLPCMVCSRKGHKKENCPFRVCYRCKRLGHRNSRCKTAPHAKREWKSYLPSPHGDKKTKHAVSCYNCGSSTHAGTACRETRREPA
ncbi:MAG: arginine methyltransferase-interacting protein [Amphiamblys sp. WSBS2006]|nr:MAG: arginine methyltransferase-interacting protein [Amphiamblys sp. WSBS2006]